MPTKSLVIGILMLVLLGCDGRQSSGSDTGNRAQLVFTHYSNSSELFVEFPALVVDQPSRFLAHVTRLPDQQPVTEGRVDVVLRRAGNIVARFRVKNPTREGLFTPVVTPKSAGKFDLAVVLYSGEREVVHELGSVTVFADQASVQVDQSPVEGAAVAIGLCLRPRGD